MARPFLMPRRDRRWLSRWDLLRGTLLAALLVAAAAAAADDDGFLRRRSLPVEPPTPARSSSGSRSMPSCAARSSRTICSRLPPSGATGGDPAGAARADLRSAAIRRRRATCGGRWPAAITTACRPRHCYFDLCRAAGIELEIWARPGHVWLQTSGWRGDRARVGPAGGAMASKSLAYAAGWCGAANLAAASCWASFTTTAACNCSQERQYAAGLELHASRRVAARSAGCRTPARTCWRESTTGPPSICGPSATARPRS